MWGTLVSNTAAGMSCCWAPFLSRRWAPFLSRPADIDPSRWPAVPRAAASRSAGGPRQAPQVGASTSLPPSLRNLVRLPPESHTYGKNVCWMTFAGQRPDRPGDLIRPGPPSYLDAGEDRKVTAGPRTVRVVTQMRCNTSVVAVIHR